MAKFEKENNDRAHKHLRKNHICQAEGKCTICPMHGGENRSRYGKHGAKKPKKKDKR